MELKDTIEMMNSSGYKERFKAEYYQLKIRYEKLDNMCVKYKNGTLLFKPSCPLPLLEQQKKHMAEYLHCLETRAILEDIDLGE